MFKFYKLTNKAKPFIDESGKLNFRLRFSRFINNTKIIVGKERCPILKVAIGEVIGTSNEFAQRAIENYIVPQNFMISFGKPFTKGNMFEQLEVCENFTDIDLIFDQVNI